MLLRQNVHKQQYKPIVPNNIKKALRSANNLQQSLDIAKIAEPSLPDPQHPIKLKAQLLLPTKIEPQQPLHKRKHIRHTLQSKAELNPQTAQIHPTEQNQE